MAVLRSHKFIVGYVGSENVARLVRKTNAHSVDGLLADHWSWPAIHESGIGEFHIWGHGAVVCHLKEDGAWSSISDLAKWRYSTYERDLLWFGRELGFLIDVQVQSSYILSTYWIYEHAWPTEKIESAMKLICMPRTLYGIANGNESDVEHRLLRDGFDHEDLKSFGVADASVAYASWSGVSYHPLDVGRGLSEGDLVRLQLAVQSLWVFCSAVAGQVEQGSDPVVGPGHDWRWLRAARSRVSMARSQETGHHRSMREAILLTSGLPAMLDETVTILREMAE